MVEGELIGQGGPPQGLVDAVVEILHLIDDPILIVAVLVVFFMYRLLLRREKSLENHLESVYNELHENTKLLAEFSGTTKALIEMLKHGQRGHKDESMD